MRPARAPALPTRQRTGARLAGLARGIVLSAGTALLAWFMLVVREWTDGTLLVITVVAAVLLLAAWPVTFALLRAFGVQRALAVTWWSYSITVAASAIAGLLFGGAAWFVIIVQAVVLWSGGAYDPSIFVAAVLTVLVTLLVSTLATPALARALAPRAPAPGARAPVQPTFADSAAPDPRI